MDNLWMLSNMPRIIYLGFLNLFSLVFNFFSFSQNEKIYNYIPIFYYNGGENE